MTNLIEQDLNAAYNGEVEITLTQALSRIAAEFYDPAQRYNQQTGRYDDVNNLGWDQRLALQSLANFAWRQLHDTSTDKNGRVRGVAHKLSRAQAHLKQTLATAGGTEIDLNAIDQAAGWVERFEEQVTNLEDFYHSTAAVYEAATGDAFKPYEGWTTAKAKTTTQVASTELQARLARLGMALPETTELQTNGVDTQEADVA